jgi:hypothetical protein
MEVFMSTRDKLLEALAFFYIEFSQDEFRISLAGGVCPFSVLEGEEVDRVGYFDERKCVDRCGAFPELTEKRHPYDGGVPCPCHIDGSQNAMHRLRVLLQKEGFIPVNF